MKRLLFCFLLLCTPAFSQQIEIPGLKNIPVTASTSITVTGPEEAEVGETVTFRLSGTPTVDLSKPLLEQLDWLTGTNRMVAYVVVPGSDLISLSVKAELVFSAEGATLQPLVSFTCEVEGEYRLIIDWNYSVFCLVEKRLQVGEGDDDPDPLDPPLTGEQQILFLVESSDLPQLSQAQKVMLNSQVLRAELKAKGHQFKGLLDPDIQGPGDSVPAELAPWFLAGEGKDPCVLLKPVEGGEITVHTLPADEDALWKLLGGK